MAPTLELRLSALPHRAALHAEIERRLATLGTRYALLQRARVEVNRINAQGTIDVAVELLLPGREIVIQCERPRATMDAALNDAFVVAEGALARHATLY